MAAGVGTAGASAAEVAARKRGGERGCRADAEPRKGGSPEGITPRGSVRYRAGARRCVGTPGSAGRQDGHRSREFLIQQRFRFAWVLLIMLRIDEALRRLIVRAR